MIFQPNIIAHVIEPVDQGRLVASFPLVTHNVGPQKLPLMTTRSSCVFLAHYSTDGEPFSGPVKRLTFLQLGSCETPNLAPFSTTCTSIEFKGHISNVHAVFGVIKQLPRVNKVVITIGPSQQYFKHESYEEFMSKTPPCPNVRKLKLTMGLEYFHSYNHYDCGSSDPTLCNTGVCFRTRQFSLVCLIESILKHAGDSCWNLKNLTVDLPENDRICAAVQSLIQICPGLRSKTQTMSVQNDNPNKISRKDTPRLFYPIQSSSPTNICTWLPINELHVIPEDQNIQYCRNGSPNQQYPKEALVLPLLPSPSTENVLQNFKPQMISTPVSYRPPPGFPPIVHNTTDQSDFDSQFPPIVQTQVHTPQDVRQRVSSWLSSLKN